MPKGESNFVFEVPLQKSLDLIISELLMDLSYNLVSSALNFRLQLTGGVHF